MDAAALKDLCINALEDVKAENIVSIDVSALTGVTDHMIIATGTSDRHIKALANNVVMDCKENDVPPIGVEGEDSRDWVTREKVAFSPRRIRTSEKHKQDQERGR